MWSILFQMYRNLCGNLCAKSSPPFATAQSRASNFQAEFRFPPPFGSDDPRFGEKDWMDGVTDFKKKRRRIQNQRGSIGHPIVHSTYMVSTPTRDQMRRGFGTMQFLCCQWHVRNQNILYVGIPGKAPSINATRLSLRRSRVAFCSLKCGN
jgi:hypothetical protein